MISLDNIENIKEVLYIYCKGKQSLKIGSLMKLRSLVDTVLHDSSIHKFRIVEACHYLANMGYIRIKSSGLKNVFEAGLHFITPKLCKEMESKLEEESSQKQLWY